MRPSLGPRSIVSARRLADAYGVTDNDSSRPDCWGYIDAYGWEHDDARGIAEFRWANEGARDDQQRT